MKCGKYLKLLPSEHVTSWTFGQLWVAKGTTRLCILVSDNAREVFFTLPQGYKTFFMLNSVEYEILNAHKYENVKKFSIFQAQISLECYFSCS